MGSKAYFTSTRRRPWSLGVLTAALLILSACAKTPVVVEKPPVPGLPPPEMVKGPEQNARAAPRLAAAHSLIQEGYHRLASGDYDGAIRLLERAVGIHPGNGPGYFYLAEAWLGKTDFQRADRFNELATLYLRHDPEWLRQARLQKRRITAGKDGP